MANMLSQATPVAGPPQSNPLASGPSSQAPQMTNGRTPSTEPHEDVGTGIDKGEYLIPMMAKLVGDPKVTRKDVIKAAGTAISDDKITASHAVKFLSGLPDDPSQVRPWLKNHYNNLVTGVIHLHAINHALNARQAAAQQAVQPQQQAVQAATPPMQGVSNVGQ